MRELVAGLCDDAALFPPGDAELHRALRDHADHRRGPRAELLGPFVIPAARIDEVAAAATAPVDVSVTVPGGPAEAGAALTRLQAMPHLTVRAVEVALPEGLPVTAGLCGAVAALEAPRVYLEVPRDDRRAAVLDGIAGGVFAKLRTGGPTVRAHPDSRELADVLTRLVAAGIGFKATAGLHRAIRHRDRATGFEQHGFLNVMLAVHRARCGDSAAELAEVLDERDGARIVEALCGLDRSQITLLRSSFHSFGTCSIAEPIADLVRLGLIAESSVSR
ncbi:hypothetical protein [Speluncibacter jeojiensis]|uniref:Uncharacterized protein n=1 Tax=Speluncibacter jeojiensis TaxID=2710754 RepID=A0A9X4RH95_9ACTN|nr:hypothetical protein [Corynebacteriales bacterium D3-21]